MWESWKNPWFTSVLQLIWRWGTMSRSQRSRTRLLLSNSLLSTWWAPRLGKIEGPLIHRNHTESCVVPDMKEMCYTVVVVQIIKVLTWTNVLSCWSVVGSWEEGWIDDKRGKLVSTGLGAWHRVYLYVGWCWRICTVGTNSEDELGRRTFALFHGAGCGGRRGWWFHVYLAGAEVGGMVSGFR